MRKASNPSQKKSATHNKLTLRLYIADQSPNSVRALTNLNDICQIYLADVDYELEIIDIFQQPLRAIEDRILVTPTLQVLNPSKSLVVGDLSQRDLVLAALGLSEQET